MPIKIALAEMRRIQWSVVIVQSFTQMNGRGLI
jgi:hypothetical protein